MIKVMFAGIFSLGFFFLVWAVEKKPPLLIDFVLLYITALILFKVSWKKMKYEYKKGYAYINHKEIGKVKDFQVDVDNNIITLRHTIMKPSKKIITLTLTIYQPLYVRIINFFKKLFKEWCKPLYGGYTL